jgi:hypothetical protein
MAPKALCKYMLHNDFCQHGCPRQFGLCHRAFHGKLCRRPPPPHPDACRYVHPTGHRFATAGQRNRPDEPTPKAGPQERPRPDEKDQDEEKRKAKRQKRFGTSAKSTASAPNPAGNADSDETASASNPVGNAGSDKRFVWITERKMTFEIAKDVFNLVNVCDCTTAVLDKLYRALAVERHPDKLNPDKAKHEGHVSNATVKFRELSAAYELLRPKCRQPGQASDSDMD